MKQMIVMISMILLGIAISAAVLTFQDTAQNMAANTITKVNLATSNAGIS